jgi:hypothetical protein
MKLYFCQLAYVGAEFGLSREVNNMGLNDEETRDWKKTANRGASLFVLFSKYYSHDQVEGVFGWVCSTHSGTGEMHTRFCWGNLRERDHLEVLLVEGRMILKWILKEEDGSEPPGS